MLVQDIMTRQPACCSPDADIQDVAAMMVQRDCGAIPVIDPVTQQIVGVITDRDIVCRTVAKWRNPVGMKVDEVMSMPISSIQQDASLEKCLAEMEAAQVRRMIVLDEAGSLCGIVSQADIARSAPEHETAELVRDVSKPGSHVSKILVQ